MKKHKAVSLIMSGFVLGVLVSYAPTLEAATSKLLGSKVGNVLNIKIDNKSIGQGAVINGTTYVPLRSTANAMGMEVKKVTSDEVVLSNSSINTNPASNHDMIMTGINDVKVKIAQTNITINNAESLISKKEHAKNLIERYEENVKVWEQQKANGSEMYNEKMHKGDIEILENTKKVLRDTEEAEKNLPAYKEQLTQLETQLADLQKQLAETK